MIPRFAGPFVQGLWKSFKAAYYTYNDRPLITEHTMSEAVSWYAGTLTKSVQRALRLFRAPSNY